MRSEIRHGADLHRSASVLLGNNLFPKEWRTQLSRLASGGEYFMQRQRGYSSASVYITEPALPVLMWSCALAEPSRKKQTSMTSDEKGAKDGAKRSSHSLSHPFE